MQAGFILFFHFICDSAQYKLQRAHFYLQTIDRGRFFFIHYKLKQGLQKA